MYSLYRDCFTGLPWKGPGFLFLFLLLMVFLSGCIWVDGDNTVRLYDRCDFDLECEAVADGCFDIVADYGDVVVRDAMCTNFCRDDLDCFDRGLCLDLDGDPLCYLPCRDDFDCDFGFICAEAEDITGGFATVCLPG